MFVFFSLFINLLVWLLFGFGGGWIWWNRIIFRVWNKRGILVDDMVLVGKDRFIRIYCWNNYKSIEGMWCEF